MVTYFFISLLNSALNFLQYIYILISYQKYKKNPKNVFNAKFMKNLTMKKIHADLLPLQYSNVCLSRQWASLYSDCFYFQNANVHADAFSSPKQTILHRYRNEINTVNQLQLNYSTNIHLLITRFMKGLCDITIKLNTLNDVPYQMTVGGAFVYVRENL